MDNFHFVNVKPSIDRSEVSLLKEAIFQRAREKAEKMNAVQNEQYTTEVKNDIMDIVSADFRSTEFNPFNQFKESLGLNKTEPKPEPKAEAQPAVSEPQEGQLKEAIFKPLKHNVQSVSNNNYSESVKDETMEIARNQFRQQQNLTMSLNFLNAQAAIQMAKYAHSKINYLS